MGQKYNDDYIRKKEREEKKLHNKKREKPSCVQTSLMKTTRNPPSSSSQSSEAELAFCGDIILTPLFFFSLFLFSFLPSLPVFSPLSIFIQQRIQVTTTTTTDRRRQTDKQTNKHTTLRCCAIWYALKTDVPCFVSFSIYYLPRRW